MRRREAAHAAKRFVAVRYPSIAHWNFDICEEHSGDQHDRRKSWSFGMAPDEDDKDYAPDLGVTGYVHRDGSVEGLY